MEHCDDRGRSRHQEEGDEVKRLLLIVLLVAACTTPAEVSPSPSATTTPLPSPSATLDPRPARSAELEAAAGRWLETGYVAYTFTLERRCYCLDAARGPWTVTVLGDAVTLFTADDREADASLIDGMPQTIDQLFTFLRTQLGADDFTVSYDSVTGVPLTISIDPSFQMADEEVGYTISGLTPYTVD
jgi:hypothetical protein